MEIFYGTEKFSIDVTQICLDKLNNNNIITIPKGDNNRDFYFTDPLPGIHKKIFIDMDGLIHEHDEYNQININILDHTITVIK
jgi:hypothetical protein